MKLRSQLLLVSLSVLVLPIAGGLFVRQMEQLMRDGQAQALVASAEAVSRALATRPGALPPSGPALFIQSLAAPPRLDGDASDWPGVDVPARAFGGGSDGLALEVSLARYEDRMFLHLQVAARDRQPAQAHWPMADRRDHLQLRVDGPQGPLALRLSNVDTGPVGVVELGGGPAPLRIDGYWRELENGYALEMALPQGYLPSALGVVAVDADRNGLLTRVGTDGDVRERWPLLAYRPSLERPIGDLLAPGQQALLVDREGWVLARAGDGMLPEGEAEVPWWRRQLYRWVLSNTDEAFDAGEHLAARSGAPEAWQALAGHPASAWRRDPGGQRQRLTVAVPLRSPGGGEPLGALVLERENPSVLLLADQALLRLLALSLLAFLGSAGVIFLFAGHLGWRIRRLRDGVDSALDRDGRVRAHGSAGLRVAGRDEVAELSRSFAGLIDELAGHSKYLEGLAGKLSHEINTPLAIVRGSLDNLDADALPADVRTYVDRARGGVDRLGGLVRAMSEATRVERAIAQADIETVDVSALVRECAESHRPLLVGRRLEVSVPSPGLQLAVAPELLAQALDKLLDNAAGFCADGGWVRVTLHGEGPGARIAVANSGPLLPEQMPGRLFDSLVSVREARSGRAHLGLGLYIVRLVAERHHGRVEASNLADGTGVEFSLVIADARSRSARGS